MNHQVEHDVDVEASFRERSKAMDFDEPWIRHERQGRYHCRVEALGVSGGQDDVAALSRLNQPVGICQRRCQRLLDQDRDTGINQRQRHVNVRDRRHGNRYRVELAQWHVAKVGKAGSAEPGSDLLRPSRLGVNDAGKRDTVHRRQQPRMMLPEVTDADDGDPKWACSCVGGRRLFAPDDRDARFVRRRVDGVAVEDQCLAGID